jgi:hypothetical protein
MVSSGCGRLVLGQQADNDRVHAAASYDFVDAAQMIGFP